MRGAWNYDREAASRASGLVSDMPSKTHQSFKEECDINTIVKRFGLTGKLPDGLSMPVSGDFTGIDDFADAMRIVRKSEEEFMRVPAYIRKRFGNNPGELMAFLNDGANREEALKLGLIKPPPEKTRTAVEAIDALAASLQPAAASAKP